MSIRITTLPNGLTVATDRMEGVETASLGVWVNAGTRHETPDINGVSHLLEHMAFKGTQRRTARAIAEEMDNVGGHLNAYTSREHTAYYAKVLKEDVPLAIDLLSDILQHSTLDPEELAREQQVVVQEIGQAVDTPDDIIFDHFQAIAYPEQALGRPVLGTVELVKGMTRDVLAGYMGEHYSGQRMVLSAAGRIDHDALVDLAAGSFTELPSTGPAVEEAAVYRGGDFREERDLEQVHVMLGFNGVGYQDDDYYAASVMSTLLGGGASSRLFQEVREKRGLVYSIYSYTSSYQDGGLFAVYAGTGEDEAEELIPLVCDEIMKVTAQVGADEVHRARAQLKASVLMSLESTSARCEQLARQLFIYGRPITVDEMVANIEKVDEAAVTRVARRLFTTPPTFTAVGPLAKVEEFERIRTRVG